MLCDFAQTVVMQFQGDNYRETLSEVFFTLSNLITECDPEQLLKVLFTADSISIVN